MSLAEGGAAATILPCQRQLFEVDEELWSRKRFVAGVMLFVNLWLAAALLTEATPAWNDWWFYYWFPSYYVALAGLLLSRSRPMDLFFLAWAIVLNVSGGFALLPNSHFAEETGLALTPPQQTPPNH